MRAVLDRLQTSHKSGSIIRQLLQQQSHAKKKVVIDYSSPNIAKPFHVGNLRSTVIGRFLDSFLRSGGHEVTSINYLGDWGSQIGLMARGYREFSDGVDWSQGDDGQKLHMMRDIYVRSAALAKTDKQFAQESREIFARMEEHPSDEQWRFWTQLNEMSVRHLRKFYTALNVAFDHWDCESAHVKSASALVDQLIERGIAERRDDGLWIVRSDDPESQLYASLRKDDNSTLYLTRELASIFDRRKRFNADEYLFVVENGQRFHFDQLKLVLTRMGEVDLAKQIVHVNFGRVLGMSTRAGKVELVEDLLETGLHLATDVIRNSHTVKVEDNEEAEMVANQLALSAMVVNDLKRERVSDYEFSFQNAFNFKYDNGPMIQMKHARLCGIERTNAEDFADFETSWVDYPLEESEIGKELMNCLSSFDAALADCRSQLQPRPLALYAFKLARLSAKALVPLRVKGEAKEIAVPRLFLLSLTRKVLAECLEAFGLTPLERM